MTKKELIRRHREAIEADRRLPPGAIWDQMVRAGLINERGEVILTDRPDHEAGFSAADAQDGTSPEPVPPQ